MYNKNTIEKIVKIIRSEDEPKKTEEMVKYFNYLEYLRTRGDQE
jgi:hypothetical protein